MVKCKRKCGKLYDACFYLEMWSLSTLGSITGHKSALAQSLVASDKGYVL